MTSNAVTWVSAGAISFGDIAAAAGADIAAAALGCWRLLVRLTVPARLNLRWMHRGLDLYAAV